jgi:hypothetical protein
VKPKQIQDLNHEKIMNSLVGMVDHGWSYFDVSRFAKMTYNVSPNMIVGPPLHNNEFHFSFFCFLLLICFQMFVVEPIWVFKHMEKFYLLMGCWIYLFIYFDKYVEFIYLFDVEYMQWFCWTLNFVGNKTYGSG